MDPEIPEDTLCPYGKIAAHPRTPGPLRSGVPFGRFCPGGPVRKCLSGNEREFSARTGATMIRKTRRSSAPMEERTEERTSASLSPERERALWALCRSGDANAREELIVAYRPLVFWVAGRIHAAPSLRQDLVQEGMLAMIRAVDRFDPDRDLKFATYACHRIRGQMLNMLDRSERRAPIPVPDEWLEVAPAPGDEDWLDVAESIAHLQGREAEVVSALFFEGKDPRAVAGEQHIDVSHVYRLRRSAVARIRSWLGLPSTQQASQ